MRNRLRGTLKVGRMSVEPRRNPLVYISATGQASPVLILTRNEVMDHLNEIVVPVTRTIRALTTEVVLSSDDGMPVVCALNFDHVSLAQRDRIGPALCSLPGSKWPEVRRALVVACGFGGQETG